MQIELSEGGCLTLLLSDEELAALGLSFEELDYRSPKTRRMLRALLQLAQRRTGYALSGQMTVEALPLEGGCLLLVSPGDEPADATAPAVFRIADGDDLLQLARGVSGAQTLGQSSSLYREGAGFWLVLYGDIPDEGALWECAQPVADGAAAAAKAAEHGVPIFIGDALPRLHGAAASQAPGQRH